ncbi:MAG: hypothetical protein B1H13_01950 [Desulfobacteraceae bacterium 4484_190.3]|nr:MAG: hypothetical protein B1H13_01950 [Desulfobacteraceae bacterium 4484_190.3]
MNSRNTDNLISESETGNSSFSAIENILEKRFVDIVTVLSSQNPGKSKLYEEILSMVERILITIALRRSNNIKSTAATFLGISRNTLHNKMEKLGIKIDKTKD